MTDAWPLIVGEIAGGAGDRRVLGSPNSEFESLEYAVIPTATERPPINANGSNVPDRCPGFANGAPVIRSATTNIETF
jgi:hypothetical protein